jgi:hypothetical protein
MTSLPLQQSNISEGIVTIGTPIPAIDISDTVVPTAVPVPVIRIPGTPTPIVVNTIPIHTITVAAPIPTVDTSGSPIATHKPTPNTPTQIAQIRHIPMPVGIKTPLPTVSTTGNGLVYDENMNVVMGNITSQAPVHVNPSSYANAVGNISGIPTRPVMITPVPIPGVTVRPMIPIPVRKTYLSDVYASRSNIQYNTRHVGNKEIRTYEQIGSTRGHHEDVKLPFFVPDSEPVDSNMQIQDVTGQVKNFYPFNTYKRRMPVKLHTLGGMAPRGGGPDLSCFFHSTLAAIDPNYQKLTLDLDKVAYAQHMRQELGSAVLRPDPKFQNDFYLWRHGKSVLITGADSVERATAFYNYFRVRGRYSTFFPRDPRLVTRGEYILGLVIPRDFYGNVITFIDDVHWGHTQETSNMVFKYIQDRDPRLVADLALRGDTVPFDYTQMNSEQLVAELDTLKIQINDRYLINKIVKEPFNRLEQDDVNLIIQRWCVSQHLWVVREYINNYYRYVLHNGYPKIFRVIEDLVDPEDIQKNVDEIDMLFSQLGRLSSLEEEMSVMSAKLDLNVNGTVNHDLTPAYTHTLLKSVYADIRNNIITPLKETRLNISGAKTLLAQYWGNITGIVETLKQFYNPLEDTSPIFTKIITEIGDGADIGDIQDELIDINAFYIGIRSTQFKEGYDPIVEVQLRNIFDIEFDDNIRQLPLDTYFFNGSRASIWKVQATSFENLYNNLTSPIPVTDNIMNVIAELLHVNIFPIIIEKIINRKLKLLHFDAEHKKIVEVDADISEFTPPINECRVIPNGTYPADTNPFDPCVVIINVPGHYETIGIDEEATLYSKDTQKDEKYKFIQTAFCSSDPFITALTQKDVDSRYQVTFLTAIHTPSGASIGEHNNLVTAFEATSALRSEKQAPGFVKLDDAQKPQRLTVLQNAYFAKVTKARISPEIQTIVQDMYTTDDTERAKVPPPYVGKPTAIIVPMPIKRPGGVPKPIHTLTPLKPKTPAPGGNIPIPALNPGQIMRQIGGDGVKVLPGVAVTGRPKIVSIPLPVATPVVSDDRLGELGLTREEYNDMTAPLTHNPQQEFELPSAYSLGRIPLPIPVSNPFQTLNDEQVADTGMSRADLESIARGPPLTQIPLPVRVPLPVTNQLQTSDDDLAAMGITREELQRMVNSPARPTTRVTTAVPIPVRLINPGVTVPMPVVKNNTIHPGTPLATLPAHGMGLSNSPITDIANAYTTGPA